jgi:hypothetical protein
MSEETLDYTPCPACGGSVHVPKMNWYGGQIRQPYKSCSCVPFTAVNHPDTDPSRAQRDLDCDIYNLKRWMNTFARLIPQGAGPSSGSEDYIPEDLHMQTPKLALPDHVLKGILKASEERVRNSYGGPKAQIFVHVCLYCGDVTPSYSGGSVGEIELQSYQLCHGCRAFKIKDPDTFQWISKVLKFGYVRAPEEMAPVFPPKPPPPPPAVPEPAKAITLDE